MQVDGISPANGHAYGLQKLHPEEPEAEETAEVTGQEPGSEEQKGVIRLLQEGHFKGVADVRLRINFHDELVGIKAAQTQAVTQEKVGGVLESVGGVVDSFLAENELTEEEAAGVLEAKESFVQAVNGADEPVSAVENAFAAFLEVLAGLVPPQPAESGPDWEGFIENLQSGFWGAMEDLTNALSAVSTLPPLAEPSGNGVAYEKFLAIYNELWGTEPPAEDLDQTEPPEPEP